MLCLGESTCIRKTSLWTVPVSFLLGFPLRPRVGGDVARAPLPGPVHHRPPIATLPLHTPTCVGMGGLSIETHAPCVQWGVVRATLHALTEEVDAVQDVAVGPLGFEVVVQGVDVLAYDVLRAC